MANWESCKLDSRIFSWGTSIASKCGTRELGSRRWRWSFHDAIKEEKMNQNYELVEMKERPEGNSNGFPRKEECEQILYSHFGCRNIAESGKNEMWKNVGIEPVWDSDVETLGKEKNMEMLKYCSDEEITHIFGILLGGIFAVLCGRIEGKNKVTNVWAETIVKKQK